MATLGVYAAKNVSLTYSVTNGPSVAITGKAPDSFVKCVIEKDQFTFSEDADGGGCFVQEASQKGSGEFTLHGSSPSIAALQAIALGQMSGLYGSGTLVVSDPSSANNILAQMVGFLKKPADVERGANPTNVVFAVVTGNVQIQAAGGVQ